MKEEGSYDDLISNGVLFQKLMESAGKIEEQTEIDGSAENNKVDLIKENSKTGDVMLKKKVETKSLLIKKEERETGIVSWTVLDR